MKTALAKEGVGEFERSFEEQVRLYYFTFEGAVSLLKCCETDLRKLLGRDRYGEIKINGCWMIPPNQIRLIRGNMWRAFNG